MVLKIVPSSVWIGEFFATRILPRVLEAASTTENPVGIPSASRPRKLRLPLLTFTPEKAAGFVVAGLERVGDGVADTSSDEVATEVVA